MPIRSKEARIKDELKRISAFFEDVEDNKRAIVGPLLQNASFMKITLEDLQEIINQDGVVDEYKNGANQYGVKQSATLQSYNALVKNYVSVIKSLDQFLPYKKTVPTSSPWLPREKTPEELEAEEKEQERIEREREEDFELAVAYQKEDRERRAAGLPPLPQFSTWAANIRAERATWEDASANMRAANGDD